MREIIDTKEPAVHTARIGELLYDIHALADYAETLPIETVAVDSLVEAVAEGHTYWLDTEDNMFGPSSLLKDWESAQNNPSWAEHIESIKRADLNNPVWLTEDGLVFDGMHRLTRAFIDKIKEIKIRRFKELPSSAIVKE